MALDERIISEAIIDSYYAKLKGSLSLDVAIVGGGPSGMTAARLLAKQGYSVALFERKLAPGGGMWGGAMTYTSIVVQEESKHLLEEIGVPLQEYKPGYWVCDSVAATSTLASQACLAGAKFFTCTSVEDVMLKEVDGERRVSGLVVQSAPVETLGWHVDPLSINTRFVIEATGHPVEMLHTLVRKNGVKLNTPTGGIVGEQSLWADVAETTTPENTKEVFPGVYVAGMAANATFGGYRMGPVFGGMLLSGEKVAKEIAAKLG